MRAVEFLKNSFFSTGGSKCPSRVQPHVESRAAGLQVFRVDAQKHRTRVWSNALHEAHFVNIMVNIYIYI